MGTGLQPGRPRAVPPLSGPAQGEVQEVSFGLYLTYWPFCYTIGQESVAILIIIIIIIMIMIMMMYNNDNDNDDVEVFERPFSTEPKARATNNKTKKRKVPNT